MGDRIDKARAWDAAVAIPPKVQAELASLREQVAELQAQNDEMSRVMRPFHSLRTQFPESIKMIMPAVEGFKPISLTVTKAQFRDALNVFGEPDAERVR